jgi:hypothetical protein
MRIKSNWKDPAWKQKLKFMIDTLTFEGQELEIDFVDEYDIDENFVDLDDIGKDEADEIDICIVNETNNTINQKIKNQIRSYETKWKNCSKWFISPKNCDFFELKLLQSIAYDLLKTMIPEFKRMLTKRKTGWLLKSEMIGSMICECFYIQTQESGSENVKDVSHYIDFYTEYLSKSLVKNSKIEKRDIIRRKLRELKRKIDKIDIQSDIIDVTGRSEEQILSEQIEHEVVEEEYKYESWYDICESSDEESSSDGSDTSLAENLGSDHSINENQDSSDGDW